MAFYMVKKGESVKTKTRRRKDVEGKRNSARLVLEFRNKTNKFNIEQRETTWDAHKEIFPFMRIMIQGEDW